MTKRDEILKEAFIEKIVRELRKYNECQKPYTSANAIYNAIEPYLLPEVVKSPSVSEIPNNSHTTRLSIWIDTSAPKEEFFFMKESGIYKKEVDGTISTVKEVTNTPCSCLDELKEWINTALYLSKEGSLNKGSSPESKIYGFALSDVQRKISELQTKEHKRED